MRKLFFAEIGVIFVLATGCATYGAMDEDYGKSFNMAKTQQTLKPAAEQNLNPVQGIPGTAGQQTMDGYVQSFGKQGANKQGQSNAPYAIPIVPEGK